MKCKYAPKWQCIDPLTIDKLYDAYNKLDQSHMYDAMKYATMVPPKFLGYTEEDNEARHRNEMLATRFRYDYMLDKYRQKFHITT